MPGAKRRDDAVEHRRRRCPRDQREHVEVARDQRLPAAHEERPAAPTAPPASRTRTASSSTASGRPSRAGRRDGRPSRARTTGSASASADPEAPRHVGEFGIGPGLGGRNLGLERHAADRAGAGPDLPDLADASGRCRSAPSAPGVGARASAPRYFSRIGDELGAAAGRAEIIGVAAMLVRGASRCADRPSCRRPDRVAPRVGLMSWLS